MRINYTMMGYTKTGGVITIANIMNRLSERGHRVSVTMPKGHFDMLSPDITQIVSSHFKDRISSLGTRATSAFFRHILKKETYLNIYRELDILENIAPECDINVATYHLTAFPVFRSKKGIPFYHMQHYEVLFSSEPHRMVLAEETYYLPLKKIANSMWLKKKLQEKANEEIHIVNPAIDHDVFKPSSDKPKGLKRIVTYGSNAEWKGFADALEAMKIVFKNRKDVEWIVYGLAPVKYQGSDTPYRFCQGISNERLSELYSSAHVVICPSWFESFPAPPLEGMACGAPVVTTDVGTEDYCFHEDNSLVVPPKHPKLLAEAILRLLEDEPLSQRFIQRGIETAKQFTWEKTVDEVEDLFKKALNNCA